MRLCSVVVAVTFVSLLAVPPRISATDRLPTKGQSAALKVAMEKYGWSMPVCVWPIAKDAKPFCFTPAQLTKRYPFYTRFISRRLSSTAGSRYVSRGMTTLVPEQIVEKLMDLGTFMGCVPKGTNRGPMTLGQAVSVDRIVALKKVCDTDIFKQRPGRDFTLGVLVGTAPNTPFLNPTDTASYQAYLDECKSQQLVNSRSVAEGGNAAPVTSDERAKQEAADKAKAEADKKATDAAEAQKKAVLAKQKVDDLQMKANDPNLSDAERAKAQADADKAAVDAQIAQDIADLAADDAFDAQDKAVQAQKDLDAQIKIDAVKRDLAFTLVLILGGSETGAPALAALGLALVKYYLDYTRASGGKECMEGSACSLTCEQQARLRLMRDEWESIKVKPKCNLDAMPLPDDSRCYDSAGGFFSPSQVTTARVLEAACKDLQKIDANCFNHFPELFTKDQFDPCHSPVAMCAPEQTSHGRGRGDTLTHQPTLRSAPLPALYRGSDPTVWKNPAPKATIR